MQMLFISKARVLIDYFMVLFLQFLLQSSGVYTFSVLIRFCTYTEPLVPLYDGFNVCDMTKNLESANLFQLSPAAGNHLQLRHQRLIVAGRTNRRDVPSCGQLTPWSRLERLTSVLSC